MAQSDINQRVAEILREHDALHGAHAGVARRVVDHGNRLDDHEGRIAGVRTDVDNVTDQVNAILADDGPIIAVTREFRDERALTRRRLLDLESWRDRVDGDFPWLPWGGITAAGFMLSMLVWRVVLYWGNWHPWLEDRGGPNWWENNQQGVLNAHWWVLVFVTTVVVGAIAWALVPRESRNGNGQGANADNADQSVDVVHTGPNGPDGTPLPPPTPPPGVNADQTAALR
jgi:hypothetical protein